MTTEPRQLAALLLAAIEKAEDGAHEIHDRDCFLFYDPGSGCDCGQPDVVRRQCAADQLVVERHTVHGFGYLMCTSCGEDWPCPDIRARFLAYDIDPDQPERNATT